jgi:hypothetical protein
LEPNVTTNDLARIDKELQVKLPKGYRDYVVAHADELKHLGSTNLDLFSRSNLHLDPSVIISGSRQRWQPSVLAHFPHWKDHVVIGSLEGSPCTVRAEDDSGVWTLYEDNGEEERLFANLDELVQALAEQYEKMQEEPGFDWNASYPFEIKFDWKGWFLIKCSVRDVPVNEAKLRSVGIDTDALRKQIASVVEAITGEPVRTPQSPFQARQEWTGFEFGEVSGEGTKYAEFYITANPCINVMLWPKIAHARQPIPSEAGIDWEAVRRGFSGLYEVLFRGGYRVRISQVFVDTQSSFAGWRYLLTPDFIEL